MIHPLPLTILIAAKDEECNIGRCLASLIPAERVVVIDSYSKDRTARIAAEHGAEVVQFTYGGDYPKKRQWAMDTLTITTPWILLLDADEAVPTGLWQEITRVITKSGGADAYFITKGFHFLGRRFRFGGFSHKAVILFRRGKARFERLAPESDSGLDMEVHERVFVDGRLGNLRTPLTHEDFKGLSAYIDRHNRYSSWEARVRYAFFHDSHRKDDSVRANLFGNHQERRRFLKMIAIRIPFEARLWFLYHYIARLGFLEGRPGLIASQIRSSHFGHVRAKLYELTMHHEATARYSCDGNPHRMKKPSVTILYHFFHPDDVVSARHYSDFAVELARRGWNVTVLTSNRYCRYPKRKIAAQEEDWNGVHVIRLPRWGWDQSHNILRLGNGLCVMAGWLIKLLKLPKTDVIVVGSDPQFSQLLLPAIKSLIRPKVLVYWCFDLFPEAILADGASAAVRWLARGIQPLIKRAYRSVDLIVDLGRCMRARLNAHDHQARCETLTPWALVEPQGTKPSDIAMRHAMFGDANLALLYSGNMGKAHDFVPFLHLARVLRRIDPKITFCFACRGNRMGELKAAITDRDTNVRLAPFAEESELEKRLNAADIHLLSLRPEWAGIVVPSKFFGSLAVGKPVIYAGPELSSVAGWVREFNVGLVLTQDNFKSVVRKLLTISQNRGMLRSWQKNALQTYQSHFSRGFVMDSWNSMLHDILNGSSQQRPLQVSDYRARMPRVKSRREPQ
jgi:glycosyltransferase involved in cell wall biosynthesis